MNVLAVSILIATGVFYGGIFTSVKGSHIHQRNKLFHYVEQ